jgi:sugar phosphate isomerase/epimerase
MEQPDIDAFLNEIAEVCNRHGLALSHEDHHGNFEIVSLSQDKIEWLMNAYDAR